MQKKDNSLKSVNIKSDSNIESLLNSKHSVIVEKMAVGGEGVARIIFLNKSLVVFVDQVAPSDEVEIQITSVEKNYLKAVVTKFIKKSKEHISAICKYYADCGGCNWQHINYLEQVRQKELILQDLLRKNIPSYQPLFEQTVFDEKNQFQYRNRIQLKLSKNKDFGYFKRKSHEIVSIDRCEIADSKISEQIPLLKQKLKINTDIEKYELRLNQDHHFDVYRIGQTGDGLSFSQVNNKINEILIENVIKIIGFTEAKSITELYAGSGNFTFPILKNLPNTTIETVELNHELTKFSVSKLSALGLQKRLSVFTANCDDFVKRRPLSKELVLVDPPRSGCSKTVISQILQKAPDNIIYISCHPVFLARDLKIILDNNSKYKIKYIQIFDMFPQTDHFETLVWITTK